MAKEKSFEENMNRLEEIINDLEQNDKPLDQTINLFKEGLNLVKTCDSKLKAFEVEVEDIMKKNGSDSNED
ncbi:MAG: exodeoxyribonuclease VII small subunit [Erysipelotrichia bacterium]|nr:exodeoxyribonuclease VII small subunit [Erysipelotrichia bacterium]